MASESYFYSIPGEIDDQIIESLEPSAAIALSQVNRHYHQVVSLHRLPATGVNEYLRELESRGQHPGNGDFACYKCLCLKHKSAFTETHTKGKRGKNGGLWSYRKCFACIQKYDRILRGTVVTLNDGRGARMLCMFCQRLQGDYCNECKCCRRCTEICSRNIYCEHPDWRSSPVVKPTNDPASLMSALMIGDVSTIGKSDLSINQAMAMYEEQSGCPGIPSPEWFDGPDDI